MKNRLRYILIVIFLTANVSLVTWLAVSFAGRTYDFWKYGRETTAYVISFNHMNGSAKTGYDYFYNIRIDGQQTIQRFRFKLTEGRYYKVLYIDKKKEAILGTSKDSFFKIYSSQIGSYFVSVLSLILFLISPYGAYKMYRELRPKKSNLWRN